MNWGLTFRTPSWKTKRGENDRKHWNALDKIKKGAETVHFSRTVSIRSAAMRLSAPARIPSAFPRHRRLDIFPSQRFEKHFLRINGRACRDAAAADRTVEEN
jgi:hypothetical protein